MNILSIHRVTKLLVESDNGYIMNLYIVDADGVKTNIVLFGFDEQRPSTHECNELGDEI